MSKKSLLYFFLFLSINSFGQTYYPFPDSVGVWREHHTGAFGNGHDQFGIIGDTIIQSFNYHKLYYQESCIGDSNITTNNSSLIGAIREDSLKQVFFYSFTFWEGGAFPDSIYKLYDFSIQVGDTIHFSPDYSFMFPYLVLDSIDSVWTFDHYRKRYHFQEETWIEGIGSLRGLLSGITGYPTCSCTWENVCYKYQNTTYYLNPPFLDCYDLYAGSKTIDNSINQINIYPNPNNGSFTITHNLKDKNYALEIVDLMGKVIHREFLILGNQQEIKTQLLNTGIYFVNIKSEVGELMYSSKMSVIH